jgi:MFS family permease
VLTSICLLPTMLMPYLVGAAARSVSADPRQLGWVAAAVLGGPIALMAISVLWVRRRSWRRLVFAGLAFSAVGYGLAAEARSFPSLIVFISLGSSALAIAYAPPICLLSDTADPDRNFGYAFFLQIVASGLVGLVATALQDRYGPRAIFAVIAIVFALSLALLRWLPDAGAKREAAGAAPAEGSTWPIWMGLIGMLLLNGGQMAVWAFFERIGHEAGFTEREVGNMIALALLLGAPGSLFSAAAARRFGRLIPLAVSTLLLVATFGLAIYAARPATFLIAGAAFQLLLNFSLSFQYAALSVADASGRRIVLVPTFQGIGGIACPVVGGWLAHGDGYAAVGAWSAGCELIGLILLVALCTRRGAGRAELPTTPR